MVTLLKNGKKLLLHTYIQEGGDEEEETDPLYNRNETKLILDKNAPLIMRHRMGVFGKDWQIFNWIMWHKIMYDKFDLNFLVLYFHHHNK